MRKEKPVLNDNLFPIDGLFYGVMDLIDNNIVGFKEELKIAISEYIENDEIKKKTLEQEDDITIILRRFLCDLDSPFDFEFQTKTPEKMGGTDIGVLRKYSKPRHIPFCIIEAKRLPTPVYSGSQETEYVCYKNSTKQGGIERFKTNKHGNKLPFSLMVGYIQKENANYWHKKVNEWIIEQIQKSSNKNISWINEDMLSKDLTFKDDDVITKYTSEHLKSNLEKIKLHHYWINLSTPN
jgi:hypothetical protein